MLLAVAILILTLAICVSAAIGVMLTFYTFRIRATYAIPAVPLLVPTAAEQIPPDMAEFLAAVVPALNELGFIGVASVHAPQMIASIAWTQVLFIRRDRGDRASVVALRLRSGNPASTNNAARPALMFATELADGRSVKTATQDASSAPTPLRDRVATLYAQHRADVAKQLGKDAVGMAPAPGDEVAWLQARAGAVAGALAEKSGMVFAADGAGWRPPWRLAIRAAWRTLWMRGTVRRPQGFEVGSTTPTPTPAPAATPAPTPADR